MATRIGGDGMILQRLYELAQRENLLEDPAVVVKQVACRIDIDGEGNFLGLHDFRERVERPGRGKSPPKVYMAGGKSLAVPVRPVVRDASENWKTTDRLPPGKRSQPSFWRTRSPEFSLSID